MEPEISSDEYITWNGNVFDSWNCEGSVCYNRLPEIVAIEIEGIPHPLDWSELNNIGMVGPFATPQDGIFYIGKHGSYVYGYKNSESIVTEEPINTETLSFVVSHYGELHSVYVTLYQMTAGYIDHYGPIIPTMKSVSLAEDPQHTPSQDTLQNILNYGDVIQSNEHFIIDMEPIHKSISPPEDHSYIDSLLDYSPTITPIANESNNEDIL